MRVISVNVGQPRTMEWKGKVYTSAIFKDPVSGRIEVDELGLKTDTQVDKNFHGGVEQAIYAYPFEHYEFWRDDLKISELGPGDFGENLTIEGLLENEATVGSVLKIGSTVMTITTPRQPCQTLAAKFRMSDLGKRMLRDSRTGFYLRVTQTGHVEAGDAIRFEKLEESKLGKFCHHT